MSLRSVPQNGQTNWGTALNNHLGQLMDPTYGGFNIVADDEERDAKYTGLTQQNEGLTVFNRKINQFQVYTATPLGNMWRDLNGTAENDGEKPGLGVLNLRTDGWFEISDAPNGTVVDVRDIGIGIGTTVISNGITQSVSSVSSDGKKIKTSYGFWLNSFYEHLPSPFFSQQIIISSPVRTEGGQLKLFAQEGTDFASLGIQPGDYIRSSNQTFWLSGIVQNVTSATLTFSSGSVGRDSNYNSFILFKRDDNRNLNYSYAAPVFSSSDKTSQKSFIVKPDSSIFSNGILAVDGAIRGRIEDYNMIAKNRNMGVDLVIRPINPSGSIIGHYTSVGVDNSNVPSVLGRHSRINLVNSTVNTVTNMLLQVNPQPSIIDTLYQLRILSIDAPEGMSVRRWYGISEFGVTFPAGYEGNEICMNYLNTNTAFGGSSTVQPQTQLSVRGLPVYADNVAAVAAGLNVGDFYRKADGTVMVRF